MLTNSPAVVVHSPMEITKAATQRPMTVRRRSWHQAASERMTATLLAASPPVATVLPVLRAGVVPAVSSVIPAPDQPVTALHGMLSLSHATVTVPAASVSVRLTRRLPLARLRVTRPVMS